jgi:F-type H+-transporting ATPase subunit alpha
VICVYCAIGQRSSAVAKSIAVLKRHDALRYCVIVVATGDLNQPLLFAGRLVRVDVCALTA